LTRALAERGLAGSSTRYERWRRAGLLPRNPRRGAGRGRGSVASLEPETVEIAAALARHTGQGQDLRAAVVEWFFEAGQPELPGRPVVPEPPNDAVVAALVWAARRNPLIELVLRTRGTHSEDATDAFFAQAEARWRRDRGNAFAPDPEAMREALLTGTETPDGLAGPNSLKDVAVQLVAAMAFGVEETGPEPIIALTEAAGLIAPDAAAQWRSQIEAAQLAGAFDPDHYAEISSFDIVNQLETAGIERLRRARQVAIGLAGFGALLLMRGLLMPDTPALAAVRARIEELGMATALLNLARQVHDAGGIAVTLASCLSPLYDRLFETLLEQVAIGPAIFHCAQDDGPEAFMAEWMASIEALRDPRGAGEPESGLARVARDAGERQAP